MEVVSPPPEHHADPSLETYVFRVGPFSIGGYQTFRRNDVVQPPPGRLDRRHGSAHRRDLDGVEIPQAQLMLHHDVFTNGGADNSRRDGACPHNAVRERFYGTNEELRPLTLPRGYGYPTAPADHYAVRGDPIYRVRPLLREPDPKSISWSQWSDGWAIGRGDRPHRRTTTRAWS
jgi:hypothetical protein